MILRMVTALLQIRPPIWQLRVLNGLKVSALSAPLEPIIISMEIALWLAILARLSTKKDNAQAATLDTH